MALMLRAGELGTRVDWLLRSQYKLPLSAATSGGAG